MRCEPQLVALQGQLPYRWCEPSIGGLPSLPCVAIEAIGSNRDGFGQGYSGLGHSRVGLFAGRLWVGLAHFWFMSFQVTLLFGFGLLLIQVISVNLPSPIEFGLRQFRFESGSVQIISGQLVRLGWIYRCKRDIFLFKIQWILSVRYLNKCELILDLITLDSGRIGY